MSAEQAEAETYRQLVGSWNFYLEYSVNSGSSRQKVNLGTIGIAISGNKKMIYAANFAGPSAASYIPIVGGLFGGSRIKLNPTYYYDGENYYEIHSKKEVIKSTPNQLVDKYINPADASIRDRIAQATNIAEDFGMFTGDSNFSYIDSGKRAIDKKGKKILNYDKYAKNLIDANGAASQKTFYYVYYNDKGEIFGIDKITVGNEVDADKELDSQNYIVQHIVVSKFSAEFPQDAFNLPAEAKIYEPWLGDMNELVEMRVPAEI